MLQVAHWEGFSGVSLRIYGMWWPTSYRNIGCRVHRLSSGQSNIKWSSEFLHKGLFLYSWYCRKEKYMTWANKLHHYWDHYPSTKVTMDRCAGNLEPASPVLIMTLNRPWDQMGKTGWPIHLCSSSISKEPVGTSVVLPFQKMEFLWKFCNPPTNKNEASQVVLVVKNPPAMQKILEMRVRSLGQEDSLE